VGEEKDSFWAQFFPLIAKGLFLTRGAGPKIWGELVFKKRGQEEREGTFIIFLRSEGFEFKRFWVRNWGGENLGSNLSLEGVFLSGEKGVPQPGRLFKN